jgi:hypothetical protein
MKLVEFTLTNQNKGKFIVAPFERKVYDAHLGRIKTAIKQGKMYDNIISVIPEKNRYKIIDGQHRFHDFVSLLEEKHNKSFDIVLRVFDEKEFKKNGLKVYLALDSAKPLTVRDIVKAYDNGKIPFFNILKPFCTHYGSKRTIPYAVVLGSYNYVKTDNAFFGKNDIDYETFDIDTAEIHKIHYILSNLMRVTNRDVSKIIFRQLILYNVVKICFDLDHFIKHQSKFQSFLKGLLADKFISAVLETRTSETFKTVYNYMLKKIGD